MFLEYFSRCIPELNCTTKKRPFQDSFFFIFALVSFLLAKISLNISFIFISKTQVRISKMERPFFDLTLLNNR